MCCEVRITEARIFINAQRWPEAIKMLDLALKSADTQQSVEIADLRGLISQKKDSPKQIKRIASAKQIRVKNKIGKERSR
jgi:hypothetical protein